jgi:ATP-dependent DNA helicase RecQ
MPGTALVISPLIALMKNQVDAMRNFSEEDGIAHFLNSSLKRSIKMQIHVVNIYTNLLQTSAGIL